MLQPQPRWNMFPSLHLSLLLASLPPFLSLLSSECLFQMNPGLLGFPVGLFLFQVPPKIIWRCSSFQFCSLEWPACFTKQREKSVLRSVVWWGVHTFRFLLIHSNLMSAHELGTIELLFSKTTPLQGKPEFGPLAPCLLLSHSI